MRIALAALALVGCAAASLPASADEGDGTLLAYLAKADLVVAGEIVSEPAGLVEEAGRVNYLFDFKASETFKGKPSDGPALRVNAIRYEMGDADRPALLTKGSRCILFLTRSGPGDPENARPAWKTVDVWFGLQPASKAMAARLRALTRDDAERRALEGARPAPATQPRDPAVQPAARLKARLDAFTLDLEYHGPNGEPVPPPYQSLTLRVWNIKDERTAWWPAAQLSKEQASAVIDHLAASGFFDLAMSQRRAALPRPERFYTLTVHTDERNTYYTAMLPWGVDLLRRLDGLRGVLQDDAAAKLRKLIEPVRKSIAPVADAPERHADATSPAPLPTRRTRAPASARRPWELAVS